MVFENNLEQHWEVLLQGHPQGIHQDLSAPAPASRAMSQKNVAMYFDKAIQRFKPVEVVFGGIGGGPLLVPLPAQGTSQDVMADLVGRLQAMDTGNEPASPSMIGDQQDQVPKATKHMHNISSGDQGPKVTYLGVPQLSPHLPPVGRIRFRPC